MKIALTIIAVLVIVGMGFHAVRYYKLRTLQKKRNNCDLTTEKGRYAAQQYNKQINQLMNFDPDTTGGHN